MTISTKRTTEKVLLGQYCDVETGLHCNRHGYYYSKSGSFITQDPIGLLGGLNNYQHVPNPIHWVDPLGLACKEQLGNMAGTAVIAAHALWGGITDFAVDAYLVATAWHFEGRDAMNSDIPSYESINSRKSKWIKLPESMAIFHDNGIGNPVEKYIHPDGREAVFDGDTLELITDPQYVGTYNYVNPVNPPENWYNAFGWGEYAVKGLGHAVTDVVPYLIGGNARGEH